MRTPKKAKRSEAPAPDKIGAASIRLTSDGNWHGYIRGERVASFYWSGRNNQETEARAWLKMAALLA
jgi:hypothetical protein